MPPLVRAERTKSRAPLDFMLRGNDTLRRKQRGDFKMQCENNAPATPPITRQAPLVRRASPKNTADPLASGGAALTLSCWTFRKKAVKK